MDGPEFDSWTRRRFGLAAGSVLAALVGSDAVDARKKRCKKLGARCRRNGKRKCCGQLKCDATGFAGQRPTVCCRKQGKPCGDDRDCCDGLGCSGSPLVCSAQCLSDRNAKTGFGSVDPADMLERVRALPISTWNYTSDDPVVRHIGPMAQDFAATFGVGADDRHIHPLDGQGVALAAIQALIAQLEQVRAENTRLTARVIALERASGAGGQPLPGSRSPAGTLLNTATPTPRRQERPMSMVHTHTETMSEEAYREFALSGPEGKWELVRGRLWEKPAVTVAHSRVIMTLVRLLVQQLDPNQFRVSFGLARLRAFADTYYMPDVVVIPAETMLKLGVNPHALDAYPEPMPLVVEAWSPSTGKRDMELKLPDYQGRGDLEIWYIHPYERTLTAWRRLPNGDYSATIYRDGIVRPASLPHVAISLDELFAS